MLNNNILNNGNEKIDHHKFTEDTSELHYFIYKNESSYQEILPATIDNSASEVHYIFNVKKILISLKECGNFYFIPNGELLKESSSASENYNINIEQELPPIPQVVLDEIINYNISQESLKRLHTLELENTIENLEFSLNLTNNFIEKINIEFEIEKLKMIDLYDLYNVPTINYIDNICGSSNYSAKYEYIDAVSKITEIIMSYF